MNWTFLVSIKQSSTVLKFANSGLCRHVAYNGRFNYYGSQFTKTLQYFDKNISKNASALSRTRLFKINLYIYFLIKIQPTFKPSSSSTQACLQYILLLNKSALTVLTHKSSREEFLHVSNHQQVSPFIAQVVKDCHNWTVLRV